MICNEIAHYSILKVHNHTLKSIRQDEFTAINHEQYIPLQTRKESFAYKKKKGNKKVTTFCLSGVHVSSGDML